MKKLIFTIRRLTYTTLALADSFLNRQTKLFVLCYHGIDSSNWRFSIAFPEFKKQINYLKNEGYNFITTDELAKFFQNKTALSAKSVVLTFDDGYKSMKQIADFLKSQNIKPTLFLLSNTQKPNWKEIGKKDSFLSISEIKSLIKSGWKIGCHSSTHANLTTLSDKDLINEVINSKKILEKRINKSISDFAYPRGKYNSKVLNIVKKAGFKFGWTMDDDYLSGKTKLLQIPRIGVDRTHSFNEFKTLYSPSSILFRKLIKRSPIGGLL